LRRVRITFKSVYCFTSEKQSFVYFGNSILVDEGISEHGLSKTDPGPFGIEHSVEALEEYVANNKVDPCATGCGKASNDEKYIIGIGINEVVERTRPDLRIAVETADFLCKW
jgi:hypothetical protein